MHWGDDMSFCSILLRFLNRTFQNAEIRCSVWKQTEAHWSIAAAKRMNWKWNSVRSDCEFGDMKGVLEKIWLMWGKKQYKIKKGTWTVLWLRRLFNLCEFDLGRVDCITKLAEVCIMYFWCITNTPRKMSRYGHCTDKFSLMCITNFTWLCTIVLF